MDQKQAQEIAARALADDRVAELYQQINEQSNVEIRASTDSQWGSSTDANGTSVFVAPTDYPVESMFHELLHAKIKLQGYTQNLEFVRTVDDTSAKVLGEALDNELQHHRMFPLFIDAGFDPERFYHDADKNSYSRIRKELKSMKPRENSATAYFMKFLTILAPGGTGGEKERKQLENFFRAKVPKAKLKRIDEAAKELVLWRESSATDPGPTIKKIMEELGGMDGWWIGRSKNFPDEGHFIGEPFTLLDAKLFP
ncbi:hypothetical protein [uncultured Roseobacter sp.]|uniref:hypothetical protein n=1 Tax=uncultured Roseobacter sp. TaxID=114847 RepID=UPI002617C9CE|nr:hypothetical protein [uncultured Roseobacter sp.]